MSAMNTFIICLAVVGSTSIISYTTYKILTNKNFITYLRDYYLVDRWGGE